MKKTELEKKLKQLLGGNAENWLPETDWILGVKRSLCLGRLIWIQSPSSAGSIDFARSILNLAGVTDAEMPFLTGDEFLNACRYGFQSFVPTHTRVVLLGDLDRLSSEQRQELAGFLRKTQRLKMVNDFGVVMIDSGSEPLRRILSPLRPYLVQSLNHGQAADLNELVHGWIEEAGHLFGKVIHRMSEEVAMRLEQIAEVESPAILKIVIFHMVKESSGTNLTAEDLIRGLKNNKFDLVGIG